MLNPNSYGYRPARPETREPDQSAKITCFAYNGDPTSYANREVHPYSEILKNRVSQEIPQPESEIRSGIIYQDTEVGVTV
jgi:hypothetical protein